MTFALRTELQKFVEDQVKSGKYDSANEVIEAALARLMLDPEVDELTPSDLAAIERSERQIEAGQSIPWKEARAYLERKYLGD